MLRIVVWLLVLLPMVVRAMEPIEVGKTRFVEASLTVVGPDGAASYDPAALEALGTYALQTVTPWRDVPAKFVGVQLRDLLKANGIADAEAIRVTAENAYAVTIPSESWTNHDVLVATRVNGKGHSRRARGPIQFVYDMSRDPQVGRKEFEGNWVWMAARIERAD